MRHVAVFAAGCPHDKQGNAIEHANSLKPLLCIGLARVLSGQQIAVKKTFQISEIYAVILQVLFPLATVPSVHD